MRLKHLLVNIMPLPLWLGYYVLTLKYKYIFLTPTDEWVLLLFMLGFTIYNLFAQKVSHFFGRNIIAVVSFTLACYMCGDIYLTKCPHMSDEHYAVKTIPLDMGILLFIVTFIALFISIYIVEFKRR